MEKKDSEFQKEFKKAVEQVEAAKEAEVKKILETREASRYGFTDKNGQPFAD